MSQAEDVVKAEKPSLDALRAVRLFHEVPAAGLRKVRALMQPATFEAGDVIMAKDDAASWARFYLILDGNARVDTSDGRAIALGPGTCFGEISVLDGEPRSATVTATSLVSAASVSAENLKALLLEEPTIMYQLLVEVCHRLRSAGQSPPL